MLSFSVKHAPASQDRYIFEIYFGKSLNDKAFIHRISLRSPLHVFWKIQRVRDVNEQQYIAGASRAPDLVRNSNIEICLSAPFLAPLIPSVFTKQIFRNAHSVQMSYNCLSPRDCVTTRYGSVQDGGAN